MCLSKKYFRKHEKEIEKMKARVFICMILTVACLSFAACGTTDSGIGSTTNSDTNTPVMDIGNGSKNTGYNDSGKSSINKGTRDAGNIIDDMGEGLNDVVDGLEDSAGRAAGIDHNANGSGGAAGN